MAVVIEEMVTETAGESSRAAPAAAPEAHEGSAELDLDRLEYRLARRRQRAARLWAD
jgi:hypothetical protein